MPRSASSGAMQLRRKLEPVLPELELISLDVFDTLITRAVHPPPRMLIPAVRRMQELLQADGMERSLEELLDDRRRVEKALRADQVAQGGDAECEIGAIFSAWAKTYGDGERAAEWAAEAQRAEIDAEMTCCRPLPGMPELVRDLQQAGPKVVFISDMYLAPEHLVALLRCAGYTVAEKDVFVSGRCGVNKGSGRLFLHVLNHFRLKPQNWLHIGDKPESDVSVPRQLGGRSMLFSHPDHSDLLRRTKRLALLEEQDTYWSGACLLEHCASGYGRSAGCSDIYYEMGYWTLGPVLANFMHRVVEHVAEKDIDLVMFPAREGYALKSIFDIMARRQGVVARTDYVFLNRAICVPAALRQLGDRERKDGFCALTDRTLEALVKRYGLQPQELAKAASDSGIDMSGDVFEWPYEDPRLTAFGEHPDVCQAIDARRTNQQRLLVDYLAEHGFWAADKAAIVDVGCRATAQERMYAAFGDRADWPEFHGCYLLLVRTPDMQSNSRNQHYGMMQDVGRDPVAAGAYRRFVPLLELATRAPHATALGLRRLEDGSVVPILKAEDAPGRRAEVRSRRIATNLQLGILDFAEAYAQMVPFTAAKTQELGVYFADRVDQLLRLPSAREAEALTDMQHVDDFGADAIAPVTLRLRAWHPGDWRGLRSSFKWIEGALASSGWSVLPTGYNLWRAIRVKDY